MATVSPTLHAARPSVFDRLAMRTGTALVVWSRRRVARRVVSHEEQSRRLAVTRERSAFDQLVLKQWYRGER
jgi:hypothetical protein